MAVDEVQYLRFLIIDVEEPRCARPSALCEKAPATRMPSALRWNPPHGLGDLDHGTHEASWQWNVAFQHPASQTPRLPRCRAWPNPSEDGTGLPKCMITRVPCLRTAERRGDDRDRIYGIVPPVASVRRGMAIDAGLALAVLIVAQIAIVTGRELHSTPR